MESVQKLVLVLASVALIISHGAFAAKVAVGGSQGWDESTDFNSWTSSQTFKVGDQLEFKYTPGLHSVVELGSESAYKNCDIGTSVNSFNTGNDVVKLDKPGTRYFACGTSGHCDQGMKVKITTVAGNAPSTPASSSSSSSSSPTTTTSSSSAAASAVHSVSLLMAVLVSVACLFHMH